MRLIPSLTLLLLASTAASAQSGIAGTWSGYIGRSEATPSAIQVNFKVAGDGALSGTISGPKLQPGEIKSGTFDASTGALKFVVSVRPPNEAKTLEVRFEGKLARDTAAGQVFEGDNTGVFKLTRGSASVPTQTVTLSSNDKGGAEAARRGFVEVADWLVRAAEMVPPEKYSYRPVATVRTFGQLVGHVVDGAHYYCGRASGKNVEWVDATEKSVTTKPALVQALKQSVADCLKTHDAASNVSQLMANVAHSSLHYGNIVTYIRMMGMVPPSS